MKYSPVTVLLISLAAVWNLKLQKSIVQRSTFNAWLKHRTMEPK